MIAYEIKYLYIITIVNNFSKILTTHVYQVETIFHPFKVGAEVEEDSLSGRIFATVGNATLRTGQRTEAAG